MRVSIKLSRKVNLSYYHTDHVDIDLEDYVSGVVASEIGNAPIEACKSLAIAARTLAVAHKYRVTDTDPQAFLATKIDLDRYPLPYRATVDTEGLILLYNNKPITASYSKSNGGKTTSSESRWGGYRPYLIEQSDPYDRAATGGLKEGHGVGMSQLGAIYAASIEHLSYIDILQFYYPGTTIDLIGGSNMGIKVSTFLSNVDKIAKLKPAYELGHDGSDGYCDCIGLIIGAIRRSGGKWTGIHGSNYAARYSLQTKIQTVSNASSLSLGEVMLKGRDASSSSYDLPDRYRKGNSSDTGDYLDYYHIGVVTSINPLKITHMTSPTIKVDTKLGNWKYHGKLKLVDYTVEETTEPDNNGGAEIMTPILEAKVVGVNGYLNLRSTTDTNSSVLTTIPIDTVIHIYEKSTDKMWKTVYNGTVGYVNTKYLEVVGDKPTTGVGIFIPTKDYAEAKLLLSLLGNSKILSDD